MKELLSSQWSKTVFWKMKYPKLASCKEIPVVRKKKEEFSKLVPLLSK